MKAVLEIAWIKETAKEYRDLDSFVVRKVALPTAIEAVEQWLKENRPEYSIVCRLGKKEFSREAHKSGWVFIIGKRVGRVIEETHLSEFGPAPKLKK